nr:MAG TPA: hypothetical protein [Caudoviricetes sp.]
MGVIIIVTTKAATVILLLLSLLTSKNRDSAPIAKHSTKIVALILATNLFSFPALRAALPLSYRTDVRWVRLGVKVKPAQHFFFLLLFF